MRKLTAVLLLVCLCLAPVVRSYAISGQFYDVFTQYYAENVQFINDCENRHLLPLAIASATSGNGDGRMIYQIFGDVLSMVIRTDPTDTIIERCEITLTAPAGMELGNATYNDFAMSAYQCYALQMAMDSHTTPYERFVLVSDTNAALKLSNTYEVQLGVYTMTCKSENGVLTILFENTTVTPSATPEPDVTPAPEGDDVPQEDTDEGAGMG